MSKGRMKEEDVPRSFPVNRSVALNVLLLFVHTRPTALLVKEILKSPKAVPTLPVSNSMDDTKER